MRKDLPLWVLDQTPRTRAGANTRKSRVSRETRLPKIGKARLSWYVYEYPVVHDIYEFFPVTESAQGLYVTDVVRSSPSQRHDMVGLQQGFRIATAQTPIAVPTAKLSELLGGEVSAPGTLCSSPLTAIVGFGHPDLFGIVFSPPPATRDHLFAIAFVVVAPRDQDSFSIFLCPTFLVFGKAFLVFFPVLLTRLNAMRQVGPGPFVLSVFLGAAMTVFAYPRPKTEFALSHAFVGVAGCGVELKELLLYAAPLTYFVT